MKTTLIIASIALTVAPCSTTSPTTSGASVKPYPYDTCIVTENKLGSMGTPITIVHKGQEVKFCCKPCVKKFNADPDYFISQCENSVNPNL